MTIEEAVHILELTGPLTPDTIRRAYRRRAFETHPDRGGSATEFLRVQAAFTTLSEIAGQYGAGTPEASTGIDTLLEDQLRAIGLAFDRLESEIEQYLSHSLEEFGRSLAALLNSYSSTEQIRRDAQSDIMSLWRTFTNSLGNFIDSNVHGIANLHDRWLREFLDPVMQRVRRENPPVWYQRFSITIPIFLSLAAVSTACGIGFHHLWYPAASIPLLALILVPPFRYRKKYSLTQMVRGIAVSDITGNARLGQITIPGRAGIDETSVGVGITGASIGALFAGPFGAIIGGALGGLLGALFGESLGQKKEKIFNAVAEAVDSAIPRLASDLAARLESARNAMIEAVRTNFRRDAVGVAKMLTAGSGRSDPTVQTAGFWRTSVLWLGALALGIGSILISLQFVRHRGFDLASQIQQEIGNPSEHVLAAQISHLPSGEKALSVTVAAGPLPDFHHFLTLRTYEIMNGLDHIARAHSDISLITASVQTRSTSASQTSAQTHTITILVLTIPANRLRTLPADFNWGKFPICVANHFVSVLNPSIASTWRRDVRREMISARRSGINLNALLADPNSGQGQ